jgi:predicted O-methyltransferase YrrM
MVGKMAIVIKNYQRWYNWIYKFTNHSFLLKKLVYIVRRIQDNIQYCFLETKSIDTENIIKILKFDLNKITIDKKNEYNWINVLPKLRKLEIGKNSGGISRIDQEILYKLIKGYNQKKVLEIGTHIGNSTVAIAMALKGGKNKQLITVDINDVNNRNEKNWLNFGSKNSPKENIEKLKLKNYVKFVISDSKKYMSKTKNKFDLIFLDGNHRTKAIYDELILSINLLEKNGILVLHDYVESKSIFSIAGPFLAVKKLRIGNKELKVKLFKKSSLALISR